jgi:endogenous inhibitor of DNA gyrase (YacG/DUF329 family)
VPVRSRPCTRFAASAVSSADLGRWFREQYAIDRDLAPDEPAEWRPDPERSTDR